MRHSTNFSADIINVYFIIKGCEKYKRKQCEEKLVGSVADVVVDELVETYLASAPNLIGDVC